MKGPFLKRHNFSLVRFFRGKFELNISDLGIYFYIF